MSRNVLFGGLDPFALYVPNFSDRAVDKWNKESLRVHRGLND